MLCWNHFLFLYLITGSVESRGMNSRSFSPVSDLGPSLAASVAGGTIIACRSPLRPFLSKNGREKSSANVEMDNLDDDDCLVVLFRSPIVDGPDAGAKQRRDAGNLTVSSVFGNQDDGEDCANVNHELDQNNQHNGLSFLSNGPVNFPFLPSSSSNNLRILHSPSGLLVAATGFSPDADHILSVAAGRVFSRISIYDTPYSSSLSSSKSVDPHRLVREDLSSMMIDAAMSEGGRPFGVQLLVVGQSALSRRRANNGCPLEIYTIDPSGGWRNCVTSGTAVGRGAERVRMSLIRESESTRVPRGWRGALEIAMTAAIDALENHLDLDDNDIDTPSARAKFGAIVVFGGAGRRGSETSRCAVVDTIITTRCYQKIMEKRTLEKRS